MGTKITDAGLKEVAKLQQLTWLDLRNANEGTTQITDAGLKELAKLQQLTKLDLSGCEQITDAGVAELQKALPKCEINR
jgi:DNA-binding PadR family transcriptional regulator